MLRRFRFSTVVLSVFAGGLGAQTVVVKGTGDAGTDIAAVQVAVNQGGRVTLTGHFSFNQAPTIPAGQTYSRMVTISKGVALSGSIDANGEMATIEGGFVPFFVNAPGATVSIERLRFAAPQGTAIWTYSSDGLAITNCRIEAVAPSAAFGAYATQANPLAVAILVGTNPTPPTVNTLTQRANAFSGTLRIANNYIDTAGTGSDQTLGIAVEVVGSSPDSEVDLDILGNDIRDIGERAIDIDSIGGRVRIERNRIETGTVVGPSNGVQPDAIHAVGAGTYLIAHNTVVVEWATGAAIRVQGNVGLLEAGAVLTDNDITMVAPAGTSFGTNSAAIEIRAFAQANTVIRNRIRGNARAALSLIDQNGGMPASNALVMNDCTGFQASLADVALDTGVTNTVVVGPPVTLQDQGTGTIVIPTH